MLLPDVNVLVYAHRSDERVHASYRAWLEQVVNGSQPFGMSVLVLAGFVRIVTNRRIYPQPTPLGTALAEVDAIVERPNCRLLGPGPDHWQHVATLCRAVSATGKLVADAQHAAVALEHACTWVTRDADFAKFATLGLSWHHLLPD